MSVKATSNQTNLTRTKTRLSVTNEVGPGDDEGGRDAPPTSYTTYREVDNSTGSSGMVFTKGSDWLPEGTPQADRQPV